MAQKIGDFLVSIGAMTPAQVAEVLRVQQTEPQLRMFGEIAIDLGYIDDEAIRKYIEHKTSAL